MAHFENLDSARFAPGTPLFKLSLPRVNAGFTVVEGTNDSALRTGPGHLEGSPLPGEAGNVVIAGHRDTHFHVLKNVLIGDQIHIGTGTRQYVYRVVDIHIVAPADTWVLESQSQPTLTLITCYPFRYIGSAPDRYIVQATLVD
jgi:sortase A